MSGYEDKPTEEQKRRAEHLLERCHNARYHPEPVVNPLEISATRFDGYSPLEIMLIKEGRIHGIEIKNEKE